MVFGVANYEIIGSILIYLTGAIASAAGVGGGILNVGIFLIVWNFAFLDCTILSLFCLFGNFVAQVRKIATNVGDPKQIKHESGRNCFGLRHYS